MTQKHTHDRSPLGATLSASPLSVLSDVSMADLDDYESVSEAELARLAHPHADADRTAQPPRPAERAAPGARAQPMPWSMREDAYDRPLPRVRAHDAAAIRDGYLNRFALKSPDVRESGAAPAPGLSRRPRPAQAAQPVVVRPAEYHPAEHHPAEYHPAEYHPAEYHPAEYHPGVAAGPGDLRERTYHFFAVPDSPASGAHEPPGDALRLSPWPAWEPLSEPDDDVRLFGASAYAGPSGYSAGGTSDAASSRASLPTGAVALPSAEGSASPADSCSTCALSGGYDEDPAALQEYLLHATYAGEHYLRPAPAQAAQTHMRPASDALAVRVESVDTHVTVATLPHGATVRIVRRASRGDSAPAVPSRLGYGGASPHLGREEHMLPAPEAAASALGAPHRAAAGGLAPPQRGRHVDLSQAASPDSHAIERAPTPGTALSHHEFDGWSLDWSSETRTSTSSVRGLEDRLAELELGSRTPVGSGFSDVCADELPVPDTATRQRVPDARPHESGAFFRGWADTDTRTEWQRPWARDLPTPSSDASFAAAMRTLWGAPPGAVSTPTPGSSAASVESGRSAGTPSLRSADGLARRQRYAQAAHAAQLGARVPPLRGDGLWQDARAADAHAPPAPGRRAKRSMLAPGIPDATSPVARGPSPMLPHTKGLGAPARTHAPRSRAQPGKWDARMPRPAPDKWRFFDARLFDTNAWADAATAPARSTRPGKFHYRTADEKWQFFEPSLFYEQDMNVLRKEADAKWQHFDPTLFYETDVNVLRQEADKKWAHYDPTLFYETDADARTKEADAKWAQFDPFLFNGWPVIVGRMPRPAKQLSPGMKRALRRRSRAARHALPPRRFVRHGAQPGITLEHPVAATSTKAAAPKKTGRKQTGAMRRAGAKTAPAREADAKTAKPAAKQARKRRGYTPQELAQGMPPIPSVTLGTHGRIAHQKALRRQTLAQRGAALRAPSPAHSAHAASEHFPSTAKPQRHVYTPSYAEVASLPPTPAVTHAQAIGEAPDNEYGSFCLGYTEEEARVLGFDTAGAAHTQFLNRLPTKDAAGPSRQAQGKAMPASAKAHDNAALGRAKAQGKAAPGKADRDSAKAQPGQWPSNSVPPTPEMVHAGSLPRNRPTFADVVFSGQASPAMHGRGADGQGLQRAGTAGTMRDMGAGLHTTPTRAGQGPAHDGHTYADAVLEGQHSPHAPPSIPSEESFGWHEIEDWEMPEPSEQPKKVADAQEWSTPTMRPKTVRIDPALPASVARQSERHAPVFLPTILSASSVAHSEASSWMAVGTGNGRAIMHKGTDGRAPHMQLVPAKPQTLVAAGRPAAAAKKMRKIRAGRAMTSRAARMRRKQDRAALRGLAMDRALRRMSVAGDEEWRTVAQGAMPTDIDARVGPGAPANVRLSARPTPTRALSNGLSVDPLDEEWRVRIKPAVQATAGRGAKAPKTAQKPKFGKVLGSGPIPWDMTAGPSGTSGRPAERRGAPLWMQKADVSPALGDTQLHVRRSQAKGAKGQMRDGDIWSRDASQWPSDAAQWPSDGQAGNQLPPSTKMGTRVPRPLPAEPQRRRDVRSDTEDAGLRGRTSAARDTAFDAQLRHSVYTQHAPTGSFGDAMGMPKATGAKGRARQPGTQMAGRQPMADGHWKAADWPYASYPHAAADHGVPAPFRVGLRRPLDIAQDPDGLLKPAQQRKAGRGSQLRLAGRTGARAGRRFTRGAGRMTVARAQPAYERPGKFHYHSADEKWQFFEPSLFYEQDLNVLRREADAKWQHFDPTLFYETDLSVLRRESDKKWQHYDPTLFHETDLEALRKGADDKWQHFDAALFDGMPLEGRAARKARRAASHKARNPKLAKLSAGADKKWAAFTPALFDEAPAAGRAATKRELAKISREADKKWAAFSPRMFDDAKAWRQFGKNKLPGVAVHPHGPTDRWDDASATDRPRAGRLSALRAADRQAARMDAVRGREYSPNVHAGTSVVRPSAGHDMTMAELGRGRLGQHDKYGRWIEEETRSPAVEPHSPQPRAVNRAARGAQPGAERAAQQLQRDSWTLADARLYDPRAMAASPQPRITLGDTASVLALSDTRTEPAPVDTLPVPANMDALANAVSLQDVEYDIGQQALELLMRFADHDGASTLDAPEHLASLAVALCRLPDHTMAVSVERMCRIVVFWDHRRHYAPETRQGALAAYQLECLLVQRDPELAQHLGTVGVPTEDYAEHWYADVFARQTRPDVHAAIVRELARTGPGILHRAALTFIAAHRREIVASADVSTILGILRGPLDATPAVDEWTVEDWLGAFSTADLGDPDALLAMGEEFIAWESHATVDAALENAAEIEARNRAILRDMLAVLQRTHAVCRENEERATAAALASIEREALREEIRTRDRQLHLAAHEMRAAEKARRREAQRLTALLEAQRDSAPRH